MRALHDGISDVRRYQMRHRREDKCTHCPRPRVKGKTRCAPCLNAARQAYRDKKLILMSLPAGFPTRSNSAGEGAEATAPQSGQIDGAVSALGGTQ